MSGDVTRGRDFDFRFRFRFSMREKFSDREIFGRRDRCRACDLPKSQLTSQRLGSAAETGKLTEKFLAHAAGHLMRGSDD